MDVVRVLSESRLDPGLVELQWVDPRKHIRMIRVLESGV